MGRARSPGSIARPAARRAALPGAHRRGRRCAPGTLSLSVGRAPPGRPVGAGWRLAACVDQEAGKRGAVAIGVKRLAAADQLADAFEVIQQPELAGRVVPLAGVVALDPRGQRGERLDLDGLLPPALAGAQTVAVAERDDV